MESIKDNISSAWTKEESLGMERGRGTCWPGGGGRGMGSRCGLPDKCRWCTCPGSPCCSEFHPGPWVPAPLPSCVPGHDTWAHRVQQDRYTGEAIRSNAPDTGRHCRRSTAGLWSPPHLEGSPASREERPHAHHSGRPATERLNKFPRVWRDQPHHGPLTLESPHFFTLFKSSLLTVLLLIVPDDSRSLWGILIIIHAFKKHFNRKDYLPLLWPQTSLLCENLCLFLFLWLLIHEPFFSPCGSPATAFHWSQVPAFNLPKDGKRKRSSFKFCLQQQQGNSK